jgi:hypothetical protein
LIGTVLPLSAPFQGKKSIVTKQLISECRLVSQSSFLYLKTEPKGHSGIFFFCKSLMFYENLWSDPATRLCQTPQLALAVYSNPSLVNCSGGAV